MRLRVSRVRFLVISTSPSSDMGRTFVLLRSFFRASFRALYTLSRFEVFSMSIKSMMISPPISRSLIWYAISLTASRFVFKIVSSKLCLPTKRPVFTSMATKASVCSMTIYPPDLSQTFFLRAREISDSRLYASKMGSLSSYSSTNSLSPGMNVSKNRRISS